MNPKSKAIIVTFVTTLKVLEAFILRAKARFDIGDTLYVIGWDSFRQTTTQNPVGFVAPFSPELKAFAKKIHLKVTVVDCDDSDMNKIHFRDLPDSHIVCDDLFTPRIFDFFHIPKNRDTIV